MIEGGRRRVDGGGDGRPNEIFTGEVGVAGTKGAGATGGVKVSTGAAMEECGAGGGGVGAWRSGERRWENLAVVVGAPERGGVPPPLRRTGAANGAARGMLDGSMGVAPARATAHRSCGDYARPLGSASSNTATVRGVMRATRML